MRAEQQVHIYGNLLARGGFPILMFGKKQGNIAAFFHNGLLQVFLVEPFNLQALAQ